MCGDVQRHVLLVSLTNCPLSSALPKVSTRWRELCSLQREGGRGIKEGEGGEIKGGRRESKKEEEELKDEEGN